MKELMILCSILISCMSEKHFYKQNREDFSAEGSLSGNYISEEKIFFENANDSIEDETSGNDPIINSLDYEVYGDDESSDFNSAITVSDGQAYSFLFNDLHDDDFYRINSNSNIRILNFTCNKACNFFMYKIEGSNFKEIMHITGLNSQEKLLLDKNTSYIFTIQQRGNYTGLYTFSLQNVTSTINMENLYIEASYYNGNFDTLRLKSLNYSEMGNQYFSQSSSLATINHLKSIRLARICSGNEIVFGYFEQRGNFSGIFDDRGRASTNPYDDDERHFGKPNYYPGNSVCLLSCTNPARSNLDFYGSGFFVSTNIVFTAAHMIYESDSNCFLENYVISPGCEWSLNHNLYDSSHGEYGVSKAYIPFLYYYIKKTNSNLYNYRDYDWAIMKKGITIIEPNENENYSQSFLGYGYDNSYDNETKYVYGYPIPTSYVEENQTNQYLSNYYHDLVVSTGFVNSWYTNRLETAFIDVTKGTSGGPILSFDEISGEIIALGCVSGYDLSINKNVFTRFNKFNCKLIEIVSLT